jgi:hypothetical protein
MKREMDALRRWVWVVVFAIAFAWVEGAIVVYLREIYFGGSFSFPVFIEWREGELIVDRLMRIEFVREIATIVMLIAVGWAAGRTSWQRFSLFMIAFGIWDIFFYVWLRVMVGWPESLMTWDLLFFVPLPWVGPVITPVLVALAMTVAGSLIIYFEEKGYTISWRWFDFVIISVCGLLLIAAFCWDWKNIMRFPGDELRTGIPNPFAWWLYLPVYLFSIAYFALRLKKIISAGKNRPSVER